VLLPDYIVLIFDKKDNKAKCSSETKSAKITACKYQQGKQKIMALHGKYPSIAKIVIDDNPIEQVSTL
jgi:hypothetical protein